MLPGWKWKLTEVFNKDVYVEMFRRKNSFQMTVYSQFVNKKQVRSQNSNN